jgi:hypothetical protein
MVVARGDGKNLSLARRKLDEGVEGYAKTQTKRTETVVETY